MNIQDRLGEALLANQNIKCDRCPVTPAVVSVVLFNMTDAPLGGYSLCPACFTDFNWFIVTPPPIPSE